jgi:hypothetical protein
MKIPFISDNQNLLSHFDLKEILQDSVYYPASGICLEAVKKYSGRFNSFVHADYSRGSFQVENFLREDLLPLGYELAGIAEVPQHMITPPGYRPAMPVFNEHEIERLTRSFIADPFYGRTIRPFALWAVYRLSDEKMSSQNGQSKEISIFHIGGEACAIFEALYLRNKINPRAICILFPGEGYGDNWTLFTNPDFRFYQNIVRNHRENRAAMPEILYTHVAHENQCVWDQYVSVPPFSSNSGADDSSSGFQEFVYKPK